MLPIYSRMGRNWMQLSCEVFLFLEWFFKRHILASSARTSFIHLFNFVRGWTRGVQVKLRSLENACHT